MVIIARLSAIRKKAIMEALDTDTALEEGKYQIELDSFTKL